MTLFRDGIEYEDEEHLQTMRDQYLLRIFVYHVVVRHPPAGGAVIEYLLNMSVFRGTSSPQYTQCLVVSKVVIVPLACQGTLLSR